MGLSDHFNCPCNRSIYSENRYWNRVIYKYCPSVLFNRFNPTLKFSHRKIVIYEFITIEFLSSTKWSFKTREPRIKNHTFNKQILHVLLKLLKSPLTSLRLKMRFTIFLQQEKKVEILITTTTYVVSENSICSFFLSLFSYVTWLKTFYYHLN